jgi:hypothetical protein
MRPNPPHLRILLIALAVPLLAVSLALVGASRAAASVARHAERQPSGSAAARLRPSETYTTYVPIVERPVLGIHGHIADGGLPVAGTVVTLTRINTTFPVVTVIGTAQTDASGLYRFPAAPTLTGRLYFVEWLNPSPVYDHRVRGAITKNLFSYFAGQTTYTGVIDVADIDILSPEDNTTVSLPYVLRWQPRPATPTDEYFIYFSQTKPGIPPFAFYQTPSLGYVGAFTVTSGLLPSGFLMTQPITVEVRMLTPGMQDTSAFYNRHLIFADAP